MGAETRGPAKRWLGNGAGGEDRRLGGKDQGAKQTKKRRSRGQTRRKQNVGQPIVERTVETGGKGGKGRGRKEEEKRKKRGRKEEEKRKRETKRPGARRTPPRRCDIGPTSGDRELRKETATRLKAMTKMKTENGLRATRCGWGKKTGRLTARSERFVCFSAAPFKAGTRNPDSRRRAGRRSLASSPGGLAAAQSPSGSSRAKRRSRSNRANKRRRSSSALRRA